MLGYAVYCRTVTCCIKHLPPLAVANISKTNDLLFFHSDTSAESCALFTLHNSNDKMDSLLRGPGAWAYFAENLGRFKNEQNLVSHWCSIPRDLNYVAAGTVCLT